MEVLVVDDSKVITFLLNELLSEEFDVTVCHDGKKAFDSYKMKIEENKHFEFIISDINMPRITGPELIKKIRVYEEKKRANKRVKIILMSTEFIENSIIGWYHEGCDGYIAKPFGVNDIRRVVKKLCGTL